jgi:hypothetical protein
MRFPRRERASGSPTARIGDRLASDGRGVPLKRTTIKSAVKFLMDEKGLVDGVRTEGREPSTFWKKSTDEN